MLRRGIGEGGFQGGLEQIPISCKIHEEQLVTAAQAKGRADALLQQGSFVFCPQGGVVWGVNEFLQACTSC